MFKCDICNYSTTRKLNLDRHNMSKRHIKNTEINNEINSTKQLCDNLDKDDHRIKYISLTNKIKLNSDEDPEPIHIIRLNCVPGSSGSLEINILIENANKTMLKVENYIGFFRYNWIDNVMTRSIKISQVNCLQTDIDDKFPCPFIKNYCTSISYIFYNIPLAGENQIIDLIYKYEWSNWDNNINAYINYNMEYFGSKDVIIDKL